MQRCTANLCKGAFDRKEEITMRDIVKTIEKQDFKIPGKYDLTVEEVQAI